MSDSAQSSVSLTVNGSNVSVTTDPAVPLLYILRDTLGLRAARFGCGEATCGACTVIVNGRAVMSCDLSVGDADGADVTTAEFLGGDPPHPLVETMLEQQAGQCGYCLSGILMRAAALLERDPAATRNSIAEELDGHLCRCGSQGRILDALETAFHRAKGKQVEA